MENKIFERLKELMNNSIYKEILQKFPNTEVLSKYRSFKMDREYFLDVFGIRLSNNKAMGISIKGFEQTMSAFESSEAQEILSHSLELGNEEVLIYTDVDLTQIFGIIETNKVSFSSDRSAGD